MALLYIDTNVFINIINNESNLRGRDMAQPAATLFFEAISCKHNLIISTWTIKEILKKIPVEKFKMIYAMLKKKVKECQYNSNDVSIAKERSSTNFDDALHIVLAEKTNADIIVTRNISDFLEIGTKIPIKRPELV